MAEPTMDEVVDVEENLEPCSICGRTFLPIPLSKHIKVCERNATRKRKVFDSLKQRVEGTELAPFHQKSYLKKPSHSQPPEPPNPSNKWREKHFELVKTIREARVSVGVPTIDMGTPKQPAASGGERCPSCDRQFGPRAFDRHVEWCTERQTRIQRSPANVLLAKERLEARTKYRVPAPKSKRALIREKYLPGATSKTESLNTVKSNSCINLERGPSIRKPKVLSKKIHNKEDHFSDIELQSRLEDNATKLKEKTVPKDVHIPIIEARSPLPPSQAKLRHKINSIDINQNLEGITVVPVSKEDVQEPKVMVTWKDTAKKANSKNINSVKSNQRNIKNNRSSNYNVVGGLHDVVVNNKQFKEIKQNKVLNTMIKNNSDKEKTCKVVNLTYVDDYSSSPNTCRILNESKQVNSSNKKGCHKQVNSKSKTGDLECSVVSLSESIDHNSSTLDTFRSINEIKNVTTAKHQIKVNKNRKSRTDELKCSSVSLSESIDHNSSTLDTCRGVNEIKNITISKHSKKKDSDQDQIKVNKNSKSKTDELKCSGDSLSESVDHNSSTLDTCRGINEIKNITSAKHPKKKDSDQDQIKINKNSKSKTDDLECSIASLSVSIDYHDSHILDTCVNISKTNKASKHQKKKGSHQDQIKVNSKLKTDDLECSIVNLSESSDYHNSSTLNTARSINKTKKGRGAKHPKKKNSHQDEIKANHKSKTDSLECSIISLSESIDDHNSSTLNTSRSINKTKERCSPKHPKKKAQTNINSKTEEIERQEYFLSKSALKLPFSVAKYKEEILSSRKLASPSSNRESEYSNRHSNHAEDINETLAVEDESDDEILEYYHNNMYNTRDDLDKENDNELKIYDSHKWKNSNILYTVQEICGKEKYTLDDKQEFMKETKALTDNYCNKVLYLDDSNEGKIEKNDNSICSHIKAKTLQTLETTTDDMIIVNKNSGFKNNESLKNIGSNDEINNYNSQNSELSTMEISKSSGLGDISNTPSDQKSDFENIEILDSGSSDSPSVGSGYAVKNGSGRVNNLHSTNILKNKSTDMRVDNSNFESGIMLETIVSRNEIANDSNQDSDFHSLEMIKANISNCDSDFENIDDVVCSDVIISKRNCGDDTRPNKISTSKNIKTFKSFDVKDAINNNINKKQSEEFQSFEHISFNIENLSTQEINTMSNIDKDDDSDNDSNIKFSSFSNIDILHEASCEDIDIESLDGTDTDKWNEALSAARLERSARRCSSQIYLEPCKSSVFISSTLPDITNKEDGYGKEEDDFYEDAVQGDLKNETNHSDSIGNVLEIANHRIDGIDWNLTNNNYNNVHICFCESSEDCIPAKRRKIGDGKANDSPSISTCTSPCSSERSNCHKNIYENNLKDNLKKIRLKLQHELKEKKANKMLEKKSPRPLFDEYAESEALINQRNYNSTKSVSSPVGVDTDVKQTNHNSKLFLLKKCASSTEIAIQCLEDISPRLLDIIEVLITDSNCDQNSDNILISKRHCKKLLEINPYMLTPKKNKLKLPKIKLRQPPTLQQPSNTKKGKDYKHMDFKLPPLPGVKKDCKSKIPVTKCISSNKKNKSKLFASQEPTTFPEIALSSDKQQDYNPFVTAERQLMELLECDDFKPFFSKSPSSTIQRIQQRPHTTANTKTKHADVNKINKVVRSAENARKNVDTKLASNSNKRSSVIDPPADFQDQLNALNDDFELIESLINQNYIDNYDINNDVNFDNISNKINKSFFLHADMNENEHGDVFKKQRKYSDDMTSIDPRLINENDNLSIPENLKTDDQSSNSSNDNITPLISNLHKEKYSSKQLLKNKFTNKMNRAVSLDEHKSLRNKNLKQINENKKVSKPTKQPTKNVHKSTTSLTSSYGSTRNNLGFGKKKTLVSLKRSVSLVDSVKPKNLKNKQDVEEYFDEQEKKLATKAERPSPHEQDQIKPVDTVLDHPTAEELFSVDDEMYEEYKKYEEMYLREKQLEMQSSKAEDLISLGTLTPNEGSDNVPTNIKLNADSAYSSLNRNAPKIRARCTKLAPLNCPEMQSSPIGSPHSSGSENSPKLLKSSTHRMSKFCHECGNKYPINTAKFCVECGVKRLVL